MAELLIRLKNNTHPNPVKDRMCYKLGDIVVVMPDGHQWGRAEGLPAFAVIQTDRTEAQMEQFISVHEVPEIETHEVSLKEWMEEKARGGNGLFLEQPTEGIKQIRMIGPKKKKVATVTLSGQVLHPYTRRKWGINISALSLAAKKDLAALGRATIPFVQLRIALRDKITGVSA